LSWGRRNKIKWIQHYSDAGRDEVLSGLRDRFGTEGYGAWWLIVETIAEQIHDNPRDFAEYSLKKWREICGISAKKILAITDFLDRNNLIRCKVSEKDQITYLRIELQDLPYIVILHPIEYSEIHQIIFELDNYECVYCERKYDLSLDHVIPKSRGGEATKNNLVTACMECNQRKHTKTPSEAKMELRFGRFRKGLNNG